MSLDLQVEQTCTLPGFDRSLWQNDVVHDNRHMGAPRDYDSEGKVRLCSGCKSDTCTSKSEWEHPSEPAAAGCPGAWYRTPFLASLFRYYRRSDGNGGRVENPELTRCEDSLVLEAIRELEAHEDAALAAHYEADRRHRDEA